MKTIKVAIICVTILLIVLGISFFVWDEDVRENPYEQCLESCHHDHAIDCIGECNEDFKEIIEMVVNKTIPLIEKIIEQRRCN